MPSRFMFRTRPCGVRSSGLNHSFFSALCRPSSEPTIIRLPIRVFLRSSSFVGSFLGRKGFHFSSMVCSQLSKSPTRWLSRSTTFIPSMAMRVSPKMNVSRASVSGVQPIALVGLVIADLNQPTNLPDEQLAETVGATRWSPPNIVERPQITGSKSLRRFRRGFCLSAWTSDPSALECPKPCADIRNRNAENR